MPFRLIAVDVDGTLLRSDGSISERTRGALARAVERGAWLAVATGRRRSSAQPIMERLAVPHFLVASQGAVTWHGDEIVAHAHLPRASARAALEILRRRQMASVMLGNAMQPEALWVSGDWQTNPHLTKYLTEGTRGLNARLKREWSDAALDHDPIQFIVLDTMERLEDLNRELTGHAPPPPSVDPPIQDDALHPRPLWRVIFSRNQFTAGGAVEIVGPNTSKAHALEDLCRRLGCTRDEVIAFGDNVNDLEMFEFAGFAVCMGNGTLDAKAAVLARRAAGGICPSNDDDGIAVTLEEQGLA